MVEKSIFTQQLASDICQYTLINAQGTKAVFLSLGARLTQFHLKNKQGHFDDIVLGFDDIESYATQGRYFGATCGRYSNRIANSCFELNAKRYQLDSNEGLNHLHGGREGFDQKNWQAKLHHADNSIEFYAESKDGEMGYPGTLALSVIYRLNDENQLLIEMRASTDQATPINMVHHSYFNLAGYQNGNILSQEIKLYSDFFTPVDAQNLPTGEIQSLLNSPFDFIEQKKINNAGDFFDETGGYDHNFCIRDYNGELQKCAQVSDPVSGRTMLLESNQPGVQFYTANHLDGSLQGKNGSYLERYSGFALETQNYPNAPNEVGFPDSIVQPGKDYIHKMRFSFFTQ